MTTHSTPVEDPKEALLLVAERLVAEQGVDAVSLREVAKKAGQRNNSAVAYHFGGREGLVRELLRRRMAVINIRRAELMAQMEAEGRGEDLRSLVEAVLLPLVEHIRAAGRGSSYAQFMTRAVPLFDDSLAGEDEGLPTSPLHTELGRRTRQVLTHLPREVAAERLSLALTMAVSALAAHEQRLAAGLVEEAALDPLVHHLLDMTVGALSVPEHG